MWQLSAQVDVEEIEDGGIAEPDPGVADQAQAAAEAVAVAEQPERELHSFESDPAQVVPPLANLTLPATALLPQNCAGFSSLCPRPSCLSKEIIQNTDTVSADMQIERSACCCAGGAREGQVPAGRAQLPHAGGVRLPQRYRQRRPQH